MKFELINKIEKTRRGRMTTHRGVIETPVFMPVGTVGTVKAMKRTELAEVGAQIILGNTYHLYLRPGTEILEKFGGLAKYMGWMGPILTDSGGYQVFSLGQGKDKSEAQYSKSETNSKSVLNSKEQPMGYSLNRSRNKFGMTKGANGITWEGREERIGKIGNVDEPHSEEPGGNLVKITEEGAVFSSHIDGSKHLFTPEKVVDIQLSIGSDIMMPLDQCPSAEATDREIEKAVDQTSRWFERTWKHFEMRTKDIEKKPALFAIIQGGANQKLRKKSFEFLSQFPVDGFSIGGVANAGESKLKQHKALEYTLPLIPEDKPRYLMGVGEPDDMVYAIEQGIDMFDCVLPTRLARHGVAWIKEEDAFKKLDFRKSGLREDSGPIMEGCDCFACRVHSRAYIYHLIKCKEILGIRLLTEHNLRFVLRMFEDIRNSLEK